MAKKNNKKEREGVWYLLELAWQMGYTIAIPLVVLVIVGAVLDRNYGTTPVFVILGVILSIFVSSYGVYRMIKPMLEQEKEEVKRKNKKSKKEKGE